MEVRIKRLTDDAVLPAYATDGSAGMDLTATSVEVDSDGCKVYHTGLAFEIPDGYVGLVFPRSSNAKKNLRLTNCVGVIDSDYRGEVTMKFKTDLKFAKVVKKLVGFLRFADVLEIHNIWGKDYEVGDKIGQMIILHYPHIEWIVAEHLSETERGAGGYGSTGK